MEHEQHQTAVAVPGAVARMGACQEGGDLGTGEHGREAARTWPGTLLVAVEVIWRKSSV